MSPRLFGLASWLDPERRFCVKISVFTIYSVKAYKLCMNMRSHASETCVKSSQEKWQELASIVPDYTLLQENLALCNG